MREPIQFSFSSRAPVFPLPNVVFFPRTVLPLHVFESRYRAMVRDALKGEKLIAVALLRPGWEADYESSPAFHEIGTLGRIENLESLPDGRFNLNLVGLQRVRFGEAIQDRPYRLVQIDPLAETPTDEDDPLLQSRKLDLLAAHGCLTRELTPEENANLVLDERIPFETAVNGACANLPVSAAVRQSLLEEDNLFERQRRAQDLAEEVLKNVLRLKSRRADGDGGTYLN